MMPVVTMQALEHFNPVAMDGRYTPSQARSASSSLTMRHKHLFHFGRLNGCASVLKT